MEKKIIIKINHPDCDTLNISQADLMTIQNDVLNQLGIVEDVAEGRYEIDAVCV